MRYSKSMIEAVRQVGLYERFDFVVVDKDNKIITRQKNKQDAKEFEKFANSPAFKNTTMGKKGIKKPLRVVPIRPTDKKGIGDTIIGIGELTDKQRGEIEEDRKNALAGFDNRIRDAASMDRKDFIKAKELYKRKDVKGLRKHIYSLDTSPLEVVMNLISIQDRPFFDKMYPNTRGGEFLARIAYQHRHLDENLDENKDDEKKRMKGAKLRLKMGDALDEAVRWKVKIDGLPPVYVDSSSASDVRTKLRKLVKKPDMIQDIERVTDTQIKKDLRDRLAGKDKEEIEETIKEDGHTDVSSAIRQCKTVLEDAMQIMGKLKSMSGEDSLPTWWTNKLAVASNSMNKIRDYILVPSDGMNEDINEGKMKQIRMYIDDIARDMKKDRNMKPFVQKFVKDAEKTLDPKKSLEKVLPDYIPGKDIAKLLNMSEKLDKEDEPKVKEIVKKLKKASDAHAGQAKDLEKAVKEDITSKDLLDNKFKEEKNGAQHFSKVNEDNYVWNFVYDDFGRTKLTTEPDKATHLVYTMEGQDNPQLLKLSEREILDYKKGENK